MTTVTREMIGAAHDVMLAKGDFILSAALLERIYLAMAQSAPAPVLRTPQQAATLRRLGVAAWLRPLLDSLADEGNR